jgi:hypothetical protein
MRNQLQHYTKQKTRLMDILAVCIAHILAGKNCPVAWKGSYPGPLIVLEVVCDFNLFFGI